MNGGRIDGPGSKERRRGKEIKGMVTHRKEREGGRKEGRKTEYIFVCEEGEGRKGEREAFREKQNFTNTSGKE